jgi:hypothetical protein
VRVENAGDGSAINGIASGTGDAVVGQSSRPSNGGAGVLGRSASNHGVVGIAIADTAAGVVGQNASGGKGVIGRGTFGVEGEALTAGGVGVHGTGGSDGTGVFGEAGANGGNGIVGIARQTGFAVAAVAADGAAGLEVVGANHFSQVGRGTFDPGKRQKVIPNLVVSPTSGILVTLNSVTGPGIWLQHARVNPATKRAVLQLNKPSKRAVKFTYFIVDEVVV